MFLKRLFSGISGKTFSNILIELFLIITGVLSALAVENYRQSIQDKKTEKDYLISLKVALQTDTAMLNRSIQKCYLKQKASKTLSIQPDFQIPAD